MKKFILLFFSSLSAVATMAQSFEFTHGEESDLNMYQASAQMIAPGASEGQFISIEPRLSAIGRTKSISLRLVDQNWNGKKSVEIPNTENCNIAHHWLIGNTLHMILKKISDGEFLIRHVSTDANTMEIVDDEQLERVKLGKKDWGSCIVKTSQSGQYIGVAYTLYNSKSDEYRSMAIMFDNNMKRIWDNPLTYPSISQMLTTDKGEMVASTLAWANEEKTATQVFFNLADGNGVKTANFVTNDNIERFTLLNFKGSNVLASAMETRQQGVINKETVVSAIHVYVMDIANNTLVNDTRHNFADNEVRTLYNLAPSALVKSNEIDCLNIIDKLATPDGAVLLFQRNWKTEVRDAKTGMVQSESHHSMGLVMISLDMDGYVVWSRCVMQNNSNGKKPRVGSDLFLHNDYICLLTNESDKDPSEYDPTTPANKGSFLTYKANGALSLYYFDAQGNGAKKQLAVKNMNILHTPAIKSGDNYIMLAGGIKPYIGVLNIR